MNLKRITSFPDCGNSQSLLEQKETAFIVGPTNNLKESVYRQSSSDLSDNESSHQDSLQLQDQFGSQRVSVSATGPGLFNSVNNLPTKKGCNWVVVMASFMVNVIAGGITSSFIICLSQIKDNFEERKLKTAWLGHIFITMTMLYGPLASFFVDKYGCRQVTVYGSIVAAIGFLLSTLVWNMEVLFFTACIIAGFGLNLCYVSAMVVVVYHVENNLSLAAAFLFCGREMGTFTFGFLTVILLSVIGWRITLLVLAGLLLGIAVLALLYTDLPWIEHKIKRDRKLCKKFVSLLSCRRFFNNEKIRSRSSIFRNNAPIATDTSKSVPPFRSLADLPTFMTEGTGTLSLETLINQKTIGVSTILNAQDKKSSNTDEAHSSLPVSESTIKAQSTIKALRHQSKEKNTYESAKLNSNKLKLKASSCPNISGRSIPILNEVKGIWYAGLSNFWKLAANPVFWLLVLSKYFLYMWYDVPARYLWVHAMYMGYTGHNIDALFIPLALLLVIIGAFDFFGKILMGWIGDRRCVNPRIFYAGCIVTSAVMAAGMVFTSSYATMIMVAGAFSLAKSSDPSLTITILVQQFSRNKFAKAYGLLLFVNGVANIFESPLHDWVFMTFSYEMLFYLAAGFIALSGVLLFGAPLCLNIK